MSKTISDMESQRRELDRQIRAAKRAEKKAADEALLAARRDLGVRLTMAIGADDLDEIAALSAALEQDAMQNLLRQQIAQSSDRDVSNAADDAANSPDTSKRPEDEHSADLDSFRDSMGERHA